jgi:hypothetical protein
MKTFESRWDGNDRMVGQTLEGIISFTKHGKLISVKLFLDKSF